jgi:hypothetical protein
MSVHLDGEAPRLPVYRTAVASGRLPPGYAADDGAALVFAGTTLLECVAARPHARVLRIGPDGTGGTAEQELPVRRLDRTAAGAGLESARPRTSESEVISELRALRAGRRRWE